MSKLSEFCDDLRTVKPGGQATLNYEGCQWLLSEIDRLQNVAKKVIIDNNALKREVRRAEPGMS